MTTLARTFSRRLFLTGLGGLAASLAGVAAYSWRPFFRRSTDSKSHGGDQTEYTRRKIEDTSGYVAVVSLMNPWSPNASLAEIGKAWRRPGYRHIARLDQVLASERAFTNDTANLYLLKAMFYNYEGQPRRAYDVLKAMRSRVQDSALLSREWLDSILFYQGVTALRCGETENCVQCRGPCSCILPIAPAAYHRNPAGSRLAIEHFREHLRLFPDDLEVQWLLNVAHMTLGEYPDQVEAGYFFPMDAYLHSELDIGRFSDISAEVGVDRFNMSGGAVLDDFDNDGRLDLVVTTREPTESMAYYHNVGDGTFEERTEQAELGEQLGGFNCVQGDYNNDGNLDLFIVRGGWLPWPVRPSLLRNNGDGTFTDVTEQAELLDPVNSLSAAWADYDNDGFLDLFICCERQPNRLYHNRGDGTFEEVAAKAGLRWDGRPAAGAAWIDYDNDGFPDLFICNSGQAPSQLFHNNGDGTFTDVTNAMGINGPNVGFSCWAWDYNNDGWLDLFATSYDRSLEDVVKGLQGKAHGRRDTNKLYRNREGKGFEDVTAEAGLDMVFAAMGSNFADFDNDGYLDFYLGTGDPNLGMLVPNRLFKNVNGQRFAEITASTGTGHLQKGHGVACGDWRRCGIVDLFIQMGGVTEGDKYHNLLFLNPGQGNNWLTVKLIGKKTNRAAIGVRIKVVTDADKPLTIHRHVSSGSSFGGNPLQQTIGLSKARRVAELEIRWPTSGTTQVFHNLAVDQAIEITEFASDYRRLSWKPIVPPR
ncbi:MAG TPA: CRTAC1 family protein [Gemmataceae bacterium]|nr:CRTAC1 family protein [Gemmataceae bacterium]